jgi:hypothetical protein
MAGIHQPGAAPHMMHSSLFEMNGKIYFTGQDSHYANWNFPVAREQDRARYLGSPIVEYDPNTGDHRDPVPVIRCTVGSPVFKLDLGELERGMYCVRVIGAVPTEKLRPFLLPVFAEMNINDGPTGEVSQHRIHIGYQDDLRPWPNGCCDITGTATGDNRPVSRNWPSLWATIE